MAKYFQIAFLSIVLIWGNSCTNRGTDSNEKDPESSQSENQSNDDESTKSEPAKTPADFVPDDVDVFDKILGDLNDDGQLDCILITKETDSNRVVLDEYFGEMDRNRRGIIILFKDGNTYELVAKNDNCFSSENEDGGVYFPPELNVEIEKGKLYIHYAHGRYGYWKYTFRYQQNDFKLIGYDQADCQGPVLHYSYSYNFLSGKKLTKENVNFYSEHPDEEKLVETWEDLKKDKLISLSSVEDFDELHFNE